MNTKNIKEGDIFRWEYTPEYTKKNIDKEQAGTLYWCKSCIAVAKMAYNYKTDQVELMLEDTYWLSGDNTMFALDKVGEDIEVEYVANFEDLIHTDDDSARFYYLDEDIVSLNHRNSPSGNLYVRKGATPNKAKQELILKRAIKEIECGIKNELREIKYLQGHLEAGGDYYPPSGVSFNDSHYLDEEE